MTENKHIELLPCPFCGKVPEIFAGTDDILKEQTAWVVTCSDHGHYGQVLHETLVRVKGTSEEHKDEAISAWNTRAPDAVRILALKAAAALADIKWDHPALQELRARITPTMKVSEETKAKGET